MEKNNNRTEYPISEDYPDVIHVEKESHRIIVVSDLHLSGGQYQEDSKYRATENFFYDDEFANFLKYLEKNQNNKPWKLIINGDFIDFIRLTEYPRTSEYAYWKDILKDVYIDMNIVDFKISERERDLGLRTNQYKSVWKMDFIANTHATFFKALAQFIYNGNKLVIIKGNHDVEFWWEKVRVKFKHVIFNHLNLNPSDPKAKGISDNIEFCDRAYIIENKIYIEHGNQYEKITRITKPTLDKGKNNELMLPYGSFLNRYFLNKVELIAPYIDNIKPPTAYIDAIFKNYPIRSVKILIRYIPLTWKVLKKKYYMETIKLVRKIAKYSFFPISIIFLILLPSIYSPYKDFLSSIPLIGKSLANISVGSFISLVAFILPFIVPTMMRKDHISPAIKIITNLYPKLSYIIMGHFHSPDQRKYRSCSYYNSGSWVPNIILNEKLRTSVCLSLILIEKNKTGSFQEPLLRKWNNCSGRLEKIVLIENAAHNVHKKIIEKYKNI